MRKDTLQRARVRERGAALVESLIVISVFIIFLLGTIYFRELYVGQLRLQRLARAGALSHAMSACKGDVNAPLKYDLGASQRATQSSAKAPSSAMDGVAPTDTTESKAGTTFTRTTEGRGGTVLNEIDSVTLRAEVKTTTKPGPFSKETGFWGTVGSRASVSCGDELTRDKIAGVATLLPDILGL